MKKHKTAVIFLFALLLTGGFLFVFAGKKPFLTLDASQIASASVQLTPPDKTLSIPDTEVLTKYLKEIVIYGKDNSYSEYCGQSVIVTIIKTDGTKVEFMTNNSLAMINGVGYRCKYEPCEALGSYANQLLS